MRELYGLIANGGFGPGTGIRGAIGGFGRPGRAESPESDATIVGYHLRDRRGQLVKLMDYVGQWGPIPGGQPYPERPHGEWAPGLLPLCGLGSIQEDCLNTGTDHV